MIKTATMPRLEARIIWFLGIILFAQAVLYVYFVNASIFNVVARKEYEEKISVTETEITNLVSTYMAISEKGNLERAYALGFVDAPKDGVFAALPTAAAALSFARNEIER